MAIVFDSTTLTSATYLPRLVQHESVAERIVSSLPLAREDGEVLISERYGKKIIRVQGTLVGSSQADLESKIDTFTELFSRPEKNLDVDWNSGTRRYVATCMRHEFDRDHFHISIVPWSAEFVVLSGEGKDTTETTLVNEVVVVTTTPVSASYTFAGSKPPKPRITLKGFNYSSLIRGLEYLNTDTGEKIVATRNTASWGTDSTTVIDCAAKTVTSNAGVSAQTAVTFYGAFPQFRIGLNNVQISVGGIVNQTTSDTDAVSHINSSHLLTSTNHKVAQSFMVPYTDDTFQGVTFVAAKTGAPGDITWRIETDNNGIPSGTLVHANATSTVAAASVTGTRAYITDYAGGAGDVFTLQANTVYWLVIKAAATLDGSNNYEIGVSNYTDYVRGFAVRTLAAGDYSDNDLTGLTDLAFRIRYGGTPDTTSTKHSVHYTKTYL